MDGSIYFIFCWYVWCVQTFFARKNSFRTVSVFVILWLIILYPFEWAFSIGNVRPAFLLLFLIGCFYLSRMSWKERLKKALLSVGVAFLYASFRMALWYEPVVFLFGKTETFIICFYLFFLLFIRPITSRAICALLSFCLGEMLYHLHLYPWTDGFIIGETFFFHFVVLFFFTIYVEFILSWKWLKQKKYALF